MGWTWYTNPWVPEGYIHVRWQPDGTVEASANLCARTAGDRRACGHYHVHAPLRRVGSRLRSRGTGGSRSCSTGGSRHMGKRRTHYGAKKSSGPSPSRGPRDHRGGRRDRRLGSPSAVAPEAIALGQSPALSTGDDLHCRGQHAGWRSCERPVHGCCRLGRPGVGLPPGSTSVSFPGSHLSFHFIGPCKVTMLL
jgi:hypothetical protein